MGSKPPTPADAIAATDDQHHGQHPNCRRCATNPRSIGTNPRGARPPDPPTAEHRNPTAAIGEWTGPEHDPADGELLDTIDAVRPKAAAARQALRTARKPPMGDPPISTRGAVHR